MLYRVNIVFILTNWDLPFCSPGNFPDRLQCLRQPIIDDRICRNAYPHLFTENMLCSGFMHGGASSCQVSWTKPQWTHRESGGKWRCITLQQCRQSVTQCFGTEHKVHSTPLIFHRAFLNANDACIYCNTLEHPLFELPPTSLPVLCMYHRMQGEDAIETLSSSSLFDVLWSV